MDWKTFQVATTREGNAMQLPLNIDRKDIFLNGVYSIRDVFEKKDTGTTARNLKQDIPSHDVIVFRLKNIN